MGVTGDHPDSGLRIDNTARLISFRLSSGIGAFGEDQSRAAFGSTTSTNNLPLEHLSMRARSARLDRSKPEQSNATAAVMRLKWEFSTWRQAGQSHDSTAKAVVLMEPEPISTFAPAGSDKAVEIPVQHRTLSVLPARPPAHASASRLRYSVGESPVIFLKTRLKCVSD